MRHEWKTLPADTLRRASDEDSDVPAFWIQGLDGEWRWVGGAIETEAVQEILRLAEENRALKADVEEAEKALASADELRQGKEALAERHRARIAALEAEVERMKAINREMAATCTHPDLLSTQEGPLDV